MGTGKSKIRRKTYFKNGWVHVYTLDKSSGGYKFSYKYKPGTGVTVYANGSVVEC